MILIVSGIGALLLHVHHRVNVVLDYHYLFVELLNQIQRFVGLLFVRIRPYFSEVCVMVPPLIQIVIVFGLVLGFSE
jgi:hypothetical protein